MPYQITAGRFVGRTQELARLRQLLARAAIGQPQVAVIGGEAGIGKTRLTDQLAAIANQQGARVLGGGCVPLGEEGLPFAPVTHALRGLADQLDPPSWRRSPARPVPGWASCCPIWPGAAARRRRPWPRRPARGGCSSCCSA
jgi:hypothetical protein